jgi:hypothetical protein
MGRCRGRGRLLYLWPLMPVDAKAYLAAGQDLPLPSLLMVSGEHDLDYVTAFVPEIERTSARKLSTAPGVTCAPAGAAKSSTPRRSRWSRK